MKNRIYKESQGFLNKWVIGLIVFLLILEFYPIYQHFQQTGDWDFGVGTWILLTVITLLLLLRLHTTIDESGIEITFIPFAWRKRWHWEEVGKVYIREYTLADFGGWGYRISGQGVAYNTKGNKGIQLILKNGKKILVGTQREKEVEDLLHKYQVIDEANID